MKDIDKKLLKLVVAHLLATNKEIPPHLMGIAKELEAERRVWGGQITKQKGR